MRSKPLRFLDNRPNGSHLRGTPNTKMAYGPALPKSVPGHDSQYPSCDWSLVSKNWI